MEAVTLLWSFSATVAMTLAVLCAAVWLIERQDHASLMLCILGVATAASAYAELGMMHSATPVEYGEWLRWYHLPVFLALIAQMLFVRYYLGTGREWLMWAVIVARVAVLVVNFSVHPNFNFANIISLRTVPLLGEQISQIATAVPRGEWQWFAVASLVLLMAYLIDASVRRWLTGGGDSRRKAHAVGLAVAAPLLCTFAYTQLLVFGVIQGPLSNLPWFLGALVMMAYETGREFILSRRARFELAELRDQLSQVERVSVLGQLASGLAHELAQPLSAIAFNVGAGRRQLNGENPDLQELRSILDDIGTDDRRAADIIERMGQLFKQRAIEMRPLRVEDVVQDAFALVRSDATTRQVAISVLMQPEMPRVLGDRVHLSQVLLNLLTNGIHAVQSRPPAARRVVVEAATNGAKSEVEIVVRDSGPGIPDTIVHEIFEPFFSTKREGMGIGLALSRTIIEAHGGHLWVDHTTPKEGAIFRFTLQRA
jgi:signal transduction histidine kinase